MISTEVLLSKKMDVPVITGMYDTLSKRSDGTITPQAALVISGRNLNMFNLADIRLCLVPAVDYFRVIEVHTVYEYASDRVIVSLPDLLPGEYFPAVKIFHKEQDSVYIFPVSWIVLTEHEELRKNIL